MSTNDCYDDNLNPNPQGGGDGQDSGRGSTIPPIPPNNPPNNGDTRDPIEPREPPDILGDPRSPYYPEGFTPPEGGQPADPNLIDFKRYDSYRSESYAGRIDDTEIKRDKFIFDRKQKITEARELRQFLNEKKRTNKKKNACKEKAKKSKKKPKKKFCFCPTCSPIAMVLDKIAGRNFFRLPFSNFKIPRLDHLLELIPSFDQNRRDGQKCGACGGTKKITDVTDDSAKYEEVAKKIEEKAPQIMEQEAKLGLGGARTTYIQGSDTLYVGLDFNDNQTYEVMPDTNIAPTMKGGKIPQQNSTKVNTVVGKQSATAWPQAIGNYSIKCANKFNLLAGAGGVTLATPGPLTFSGGITKFVGPSISIGCASGPLTMEGNSVSVTGKTIALTPTSGEVFIKGSLSMTANLMTGGHGHFESISFAKASCVSTTKSTYTAIANADVLQTTKPAWGSAAVKGGINDLKLYFQSVPMDASTAAFRTQSPGEAENIGNRIKSILGLTPPWEFPPHTPMNATGYVLPGRFISIQGTVNGSPAIIEGLTTVLVPVNNIPHAHGIPEMMHKHEVQMPDIDFSADSAQALRDKVINGAQESGVPADPTNDTQTRIADVARTAVEFAAAQAVKITSLVHKILSLI